MHSSPGATSDMGSPGSASGSSAGHHDDPVPLMYLLGDAACGAQDASLYILAPYRSPSTSVGLTLPIHIID